MSDETEIPIFDVSGKVALVTGASSGFGDFFARKLASYGASVVVAARRKARLEQLAQDIQANGGKAVAVALDVTDATSVRDAFAEAEAAYGTVNIVSNNAGVVDAKLAVEIDESSWDFVLDTNLKGAWLVASEAGRRMIAANVPGSIVNTASILGLRVALTTSSYSASKAGLISLTQSLALEWSRAKIRVNALCPGYFETELNATYLKSERGREYLAQSPAGRSGNMQELEAAFMLLASDAGSFVNGIALPVDGGHSVGNM
jgi:NAD(P)-dependent dehydrogenase (short-subunit alcohol dehydrogenase family)